MIDNIDWLIELMGDLDRELALLATDEMRNPMGDLVDAVRDDCRLITEATVNPLWQKPAGNILTLER